MHLLLISLRVAIQLVLVIALADFLAGAIHWAEDAYFTEATPVVGPLFIRPNIVHHHHPRFFTHLTWWQSSWDLALVGALLLLAAWPLGLLGWPLGLFVALSINANEIHKWSHRTRKKTAGSSPFSRTGTFSRPRAITASITPTRKTPSIARSRIL